MKPVSFAEHVAFPGAEVCGYGWPASYAHLHDGIRSGELPARYITWSTEDGGLGDQLLGLASLFVAALLTKRAIILRNPHLETVFEPSEVDWRWDPSSGVPMHGNYKCWRHECRNQTVSRRHGRKRGVLNINVGDGRPTDAKGRTAQNPTGILDLLVPLQNYTNLRVWTSGGVVTGIYDARNDTRRALEVRGLRSSVAFPCIIRYLLRPKRILLQYAKKYYQKVAPLGPPSVCVHLRTVDDLQNIHPGQQAQNFTDQGERILDCGKEITRRVWPKTGSNRTWLLTADSYKLKTMARHWAKTENTKLETTSIRPKPFNDRGAASTVIEWLLFTLCKVYLGPQSEFSRTAFAYNMKKPLAFLLPQSEGESWSDRRPGNSTCPVVPASTVDLGAWNRL